MYLVKMNRCCDSKKHSYDLGVYTHPEEADWAAKVERYWCSGQYQPEIISLPDELDMIDDEKESLYLKYVDRNGRDPFE